MFVKACGENFCYNKTVINLEIIAYIEGQKNAGVSDVEILDTLIENGGWSKSDIQEAFGIINLPKGSVQAAQIRAAVLRNQIQKQTHRKVFGKFVFSTFILLILFGIVGSGVWFLTRDAALQQNIVDEVTSLPNNFTLDKLRSFRDNIYNAIASEASSTQAEFTVITDTNIVASTTATTISSDVTECGSWIYDTAEEERAGISSSVCFSEHFKSCTPATFSATFNDYTTTFTIQSSKEKSCLVKEEIDAPSFDNPQVILCTFDKSRSWSTAQDDSSKVCKPML